MPMSGDELQMSHSVEPNAEQHNMFLSNVLRCEHNSSLKRSHDFTFDFKTVSEVEESIQNNWMIRDLINRIEEFEDKKVLYEEWNSALIKTPLKVKLDPEIINSTSSVITRVRNELSTQRASKTKASVASILLAISNSFDVEAGHEPDEEMAKELYKKAQEELKNTEYNITIVKNLSE